MSPNGQRVSRLSVLVAPEGPTRRPDRAICEFHWVDCSSCIAPSQFPTPEKITLVGCTSYSTTAERQVYLQMQKQDSATLLPCPCVHSKPPRSFYSTGEAKFSDL